MGRRFNATTCTYDGVSNVTSNVTSVDTILPGNQTDNQAFCYDEQNQLTWASSATTSSTPCGGSNTAGTLSSAVYTQAFAYDATGRLTSSPTGSYTYGDSAHLHAVTAIGSSAYSASYDAAGDMTCRVLNTVIHCPGSPIVQEMSYDNERRLTHWQNLPTSPTATDDSLYDGSGMRVEQDTVVSGVTTDTAYLLGGMEEVTGGVVTKYLGVAGLPTAIRVGTSGSLNYLASDGLGSVSEALDGSGNVVAAQLYTPYGQTRYSSGTMPTAKGFTGQRADSVSGLDYYGARYYDPVAEQFTEADSALDGMSPYAYVRGNPETLVDPTGQRHCDPSNCYGGGDGNGDPSGNGPGSKGCTHNCGGPSGKKGGPKNPPECDSHCQAKGQNVLKFLEDLIPLLEGASFLNDISDLISQVGRLFTLIPELLAQDWLVIPALVDAATHVVRDGLDIAKSISGLLRDLGIRSGVLEQISSIVSTASIVADLLTPFVDIASEIGDLLFNPLDAISGDIRSAVGTVQPDLRSRCSIVA